MQISTIRGRVSGRRRLNLGGNAQDGEQSKAGTDVATGYGARTAVIGWVGAWVFVPPDTSNSRIAPLTNLSVCIG